VGELEADRKKKKRDERRKAKDGEGDGEAAGGGEGDEGGSVVVPGFYKDALAGSDKEYKVGRLPVSLLFPLSTLSPGSLPHPRLSPNGLPRLLQVEFLAHRIYIMNALAKPDETAEADKKKEKDAEKVRRDERLSRRAPSPPLRRFLIPRDLSPTALPLIYVAGAGRDRAPPRRQGAPEPF